MSETKYCGNCKHFKDEDVEGWGWCSKFITQQHVKESECTWYISKFVANHKLVNGWTEITPDNMDEVDCIPKDKVVIGWICNKEFRSCSLSCFWFTLKSIAREGGFYYYVLPELKIKDE